jgi:hypothetical protein
LKDDSLEIGECWAAESQCGLKPLQAELSGVESTPKLVERRALFIQYLIARRVEEDQMPWALKAVGKAYVALAFLSVKSFDGDDHRLVGLESFEDGGGKQLMCASLNVTSADPLGQQRAYPRARENGAALLHDPSRKPDGLRSRGADYDDQAARRVAHPIGRSENATADGDVHRRGRRTVAAWTLR